MSGKKILQNKARRSAQKRTDAGLVKERPGTDEEHRRYTGNAGREPAPEDWRTPRRWARDFDRPKVRVLIVAWSPFWSGIGVLNRSELLFRVDEERPNRVEFMHK